MQSDLMITLKSRIALKELLLGIPKDQLFEVPQGFRNSIFWNAGHLSVVQQQLSYGLSGLPMLINLELVKYFQRGSFPDRDGQHVHYSGIIESLISNIEQTQKDYAAGIFKEFKPLTVAISIELKSIEDALRFNNYHEGVHMGYILALRKALAR